MYRIQFITRTDLGDNNFEDPIFVNDEADMSKIIVERHLEIVTHAIKNGSTLEVVEYGKEVPIIREKPKGNLILPTIEYLTIIERY